MAAEISGRDAMDRVEAIRSIREKSTGMEVAGKEGTGQDNSGIPIIAMTACAMNGDEERFLAAGMGGHLAKPVKMQDLRDLSGRYEKKRSGR